MSEAPKTISNKKLAVMAAGMVVAPLLFFGGYMALKAGSKSEVSGSIQLGEEKAQLAPNRCESGTLSEDAPRSRAQFHGVDLFDAAEPERRVRLIEDPEKGKRVIVRNGEAAPVVVNRDGCGKFEIKLEETGAMILDHYGFEGTLELECPEIVADVTFASCYDGS
jgi:hypothetical protein